MREAIMVGGVDKVLAHLSWSPTCLCRHCRGTSRRANLGLNFLKNVKSIPDGSPVLLGPQGVLGAYAPRLLANSLVWGASQSHLERLMVWLLSRSPSPPIPELSSNMGKVGGMRLRISYKPAMLSPILSLSMIQASLCKVANLAPYEARILYP